MKKKRNYDKKVKLTRILLADYLLLKGYALDAGVSMAEALHTIITREWAMAKRKTRAVAEPVFGTQSPVALRQRPQPIIATNGHSSVAFRIQPKGVRND
ncbi:hypothetical protein ES705_44641 [subsurface metagenome]